MITLTLTKQYLNLHSSNTTEDELIQLLMDAAETQAYKLIGQDGMIDSPLIDLALLKDIATNYMHRENYLDAENGGIILSNNTISILNQYRKVIVY